MKYKEVWTKTDCRITEDTKFKSQTSANQQANIAEDCLDIELNG